MLHALAKQERHVNISAGKIGGSENLRNMLRGPELRNEPSASRGGESCEFLGLPRKYELIWKRFNIL